MVADSAAEHGEPGFECIEHGTLSYRRRNLQLDLARHPSKPFKMKRQSNADHSLLPVPPVILHALLEVSPRLEELCLGPSWVRFRTLSKGQVNDGIAPA